MSQCGYLTVVGIGILIDSRHVGTADEWEQARNMAFKICESWNDIEQDWSKYSRMRKQKIWKENSTALS